MGRPGGVWGVSGNLVAWGRTSFQSGPREEEEGMSNSTHLRPDEEPHLGSINIQPGRFAINETSFFSSSLLSPTATFASQIILFDFGRPLFQHTLKLLKA